jgi:hypothetical protein
VTATISGDKKELATPTPSQPDCRAAGMNRRHANLASSSLSNRERMVGDRHPGE